MNINIQTIPHNQHRYLTCGDWWFETQDVTGEKLTERIKVLQIRVSDMGNEDYESLVALHELVEVLLCQKRGITTEEVDAFDKAFEAARPDGNNDEPGDDPKAPYKKEHFFATNIEKLMSAELGVDWTAYEAAINRLP